MNIKTTKIRITKGRVNLKFQNIMILSKEEYDKAREYVPTIEDNWWLRSLGSISISAACVFSGDVGHKYVEGELGVRPALQINNLKSTDLEPGDKIELANYTWTIIPGDIALCDKVVGYCAFRDDFNADDANNYESSDIKKFVEEWWANIIEIKTLPIGKVTGITLLSKDEFLNAKDYIPNIGNTLWWLRSPGYYVKFAACVYGEYGSVFVSGYNVDLEFGVRPALKITDLESAGLKPGNKIAIAGYNWTVISKDMALCDKVVGYCAFRDDFNADDANNYESSDIKKFVEEWWANIIEPKTLPISKVTGITLLSKDEYLNAKDYIPNIGNTCWWLRSPGIGDFGAACVDGGYGLVIACGGFVLKEFSVRPALTLTDLESAGLKPGDEIAIGGYTWTIIPGDMALCDDIIGDCAFRIDWKAEDANEYKASDVKRFVEHWWADIKSSL